MIIPLLLKLIRGFNHFFGHSIVEFNRLLDEILVTGVPTLVAPYHEWDIETLTHLM